MNLEAHKNENGDVLVTFSDRTAEWTDLCVGIQKEWMDPASEGFIENWQDRIRDQFKAHTSGAPYPQSKVLEAVESAEVTDGVVPKG